MDNHSEGSISENSKTDTKFDKIAFLLRVWNWG